MKNFMSILAAGVLVVLVTVGLTSNQVAAAVAGKKINVVIEYGNGQPARTVAAIVAPGQTVLGVLQTVATVETHPVDRYVFVTAIDGVQGKRGEMAWYYTIDGNKADKLAAANVLADNTEQIKWSYQKDVCSCTVDKK
jgi:hypothetical protein